MSRNISARHPRLREDDGMMRFVDKIYCDEAPQLNKSSSGFLLPPAGLAGTRLALNS